MSEQRQAETGRTGSVSLMAIISISIAVVSVAIAIGAIITAQQAVESADLAERRAELAIERQRRMTGTDSTAVGRSDPRAVFLASTADRSKLLDEGLDQWTAFYARYQEAPPSMQYRAFTSFFEHYPLTEQYFFFVSREEPFGEADSALRSADQDSYEAFRDWLDLRQSMSP